MQDDRERVPQARERPERVSLASPPAVRPRPSSCCQGVVATFQLSFQGKIHILNFLNFKLLYHRCLLILATEILADEKCLDSEFASVEVTGTLRTTP